MISRPACKTKSTPGYDRASPHRPDFLLILGVLDIATEKPHRINGEIRVPEVRLIGVEGEQLGVVKTADALLLSEQHDVDLVEIAPNAEPPVCRLMDYGKFKYQEQKRQQEARSKQKIIQVKEVKFRPGTDEGDYQVKLRNLRRFIEEGDKAKVTLRFRGREMAHQELGMRVLERVRDDLTELCLVEAMPKLEGRQMVMVLAPRKKVTPGKPGDATS
ncbi:translation initiation factor IF-3 [Pollutimonas bauzanensis]|uniref:Translation initiation factor IF-3 n=1 Tax=Pollutimonas bauzanensis TaxID=658167 RepID=A0A1M5LS81_9BURK|nr:translation initiation factor IF-3 [Pollutimonas bauzanensis]SHG67908.1 translation initiation factor IF-3 [Pollutimonas bauzanensis]